ncbi:MAG: DUF58 domain-containing protein [Dehalococcoidia bacterium]|nr:DUF58 domain-containing protein [Dehalococcoidia bacterium]
MPFRESWLVLGPFLVVLGFLAGEPFISGIGVVVVAIGAVARYWSKHVFDRLTLRRTLRQRRVFVDEPATLHAELENAKPLPLPWFEWRLAVAEHASFPGEQLSAAAAPGFSWLVRRGAIGWYERQSWDFELTVSERGYHQVGPASLRSADLLGLFPRHIEDVAVDHLVVFPRVYTIPELGLPPNRPFGELKGRNRIFEDPRRIAGIREYREGDPLKRIDWKATARAGELQSRVYEPSATLQLYVLLNIDTLEHSWEGYRKHDLERTVSVAASVAVWGAEERFAVGLLANGSFPGRPAPAPSPVPLLRPGHARPGRAGHGPAPHHG